MSAPGTTSETSGLAHLLGRAEHIVTRRIERCLHSGLTIEQWRILDLLADGRGHRMSEIADFAMVPPPTLTKIVDRMIDRNLVYRRVDGEDRRRILVFLTTRGRDAHRRNAAKVQREQVDLVAGLGSADAELLSELLARLARLD